MHYELGMNRQRSNTEGISVVSVSNRMLRRGEADEKQTADFVDSKQMQQREIMLCS